MLVSSSGQWVGGISGGCLEGDALIRSQKAIFNKAPSLVVYDTMEDDANQIGVGLGCNGRIEVLFTPINPNDSGNPIEQLRTISKSTRPSILLKVIESDSEKVKIGFSQLILPDQSSLEFCNIDIAPLKEGIREVETLKRPLLKEYATKENARLKLLIEFIPPETKLIIVGDNYDVNALVGIANELGWECHIVGRKKKMSKYTFKLAKAVYEYEEFSKITLDEYSAVVLMTHDYQWDKKILPHVIDQAVPYIGMLGPKKRMYKMQKDLGITSFDHLPHFYSPVGLDIGAESPEEIALSIAAEIVAAFKERKGQSLKYKEGVIHDRN
jgi:xanthine/CO dehydrogenase XdhC/CoxF family maturation factor